MARTEPGKRTLWFLYPVFGPAIEDSPPALANPMFGDATLLSTEVLVHELGGSDSRSSVLRLLGYRQDQRVAGFVAVRRMAPVKSIEARFKLDDVLVIGVNAQNKPVGIGKLEIREKDGRLALKIRGFMGFGGRKRMKLRKKTEEKKPTK